MAYREFQNERLYDSPDFDGNPRELSVLQHLNDQQARQKLFQQQKANQDWEDIKKVHATTTDPVIDRMIGERIMSIKKNVQKDIMQFGIVTPKTKLQMDEVTELNDNGKAIVAERKRGIDEIHKVALRDKYYDPKNDLDAYDETIPQTSNDLREHQRNIENMLVRNRANVGHIQDIAKTFKKEDYLHDTVAELGKNKKSYEEDYTDENGVKIGGKREAVFVTPTGIPTNEPNDEDVHKYLNGHPKAKIFYLNQAGEKISKEIEENFAEDPDWVVKNSSLSPQSVASMSKGDIIDGIISGKIKNPNPHAKGLNYNDVAFQNAKNDLKNAATYLTKISTDYANSGNGGKYGMRSKLMNYTPGVYSGNYAGVGGSFTKKNGQKYQINTTASDRLNTISGKTIHGIHEGYRPFNVENNQLVLTDDKNNIVPLPSKSNDPTEVLNDVISYIKNLPPGEANKYQLKQGLRGQFFDATNIMSAAEATAQEYNKNGQSDVANSILKAAKDLVSVQGITDPTEQDLQAQQVAQGILSQYVKSGTMHPEILIPSGNDLAKIKGDTGKDLNDRKTWTQGEKAVEQAFEEKKKEIAPKIEAVEEYWKTPKGQKELKKINSQKAIPKFTAENADTEYHKLKSGDYFIDPEGVKRQKP